MFTRWTRQTEKVAEARKLKLLGVITAPAPTNGNIRVVAGLRLASPACCLRGARRRCMDLWSRLIRWAAVTAAESNRGLFREAAILTLNKLKRSDIRATMVVHREDTLKIIEELLLPTAFGRSSGRPNKSRALMGSLRHAFGPLPCVCAPSAALAKCKPIQLDGIDVVFHES